MGVDNAVANVILWLELKEHVKCQWASLKYLQWRRIIYENLASLMQIKNEYLGYVHWYCWLVLFVLLNNFRFNTSPYLPTPPLGQDMTQDQFFKQSLTGLNSEFSFS